MSRTRRDYARRRAAGGCRREPEVARAYAEEAIALCEQNGFALWLLFGQALRGWALTELRQREQGIAEMSIACLQRMGRALRQQYLIALLAQAYARTGKTEKAPTMLSEALEHAERTDEKDRLRRDAPA
jgi:hypothetical protein